nr:hypothetical protein [uncultured Roseococcus sp.]
MDDVVLSKRLDQASTLYITTLDRNTYEQFAENDLLGGGGGYFVVRSTRDGKHDRLEILAKASSFEAAGQLFDLIEPDHM